MKRFFAIITLLTIVLCSFAQAFKAYIQVTYIPVQRSATIIVGDSAVIPKDEKGQPLKFNTTISLLNWLSQKGWYVEPININNGNPSNITFLMSRDNTTEKEIANMFR